MSGSAVRAGRAFIEVFLKDQVTASLRGMTTRLRGMSRLIGSLGGGLLGAGAAAGAAFLAPISAASRLNEVMSKFDVVFGDNSEAMKAWGDDFAKAVGRSKGTIAEFLAESQDLFVPIGFDRDAAAGLSKTITGLAVDLASFGNTSDADALRDLQAALTGSSETVRKYGVNIKEAAVKQELLNQGIDPTGASEQEKVMARLAIIIRSTSDAQGDAIKTAGSWANQNKRIQDGIKDASAAIGNVLIPLLSPYQQKLGNIIASSEDWIGKNRAVVVAVAAGAGVLAASGAALIGLSGALWAASFATSALATVSGLLGFAFAGIAAIAASPVALLVVGAMAATAAWVYFSDEITATVGVAANVLGQLGTTIAGVVGGIAQRIGTAWQQVIEFVSSLPLSAAIANAVSPIGTIISAAFGASVQFVQDSFQSIGQIVSTSVANVAASWSAFASAVSGWFSGIAAEATIAWDGISAAMAIGDLQSAWTIAWNTMKIVALQTFGPLALAWNEFTTGLVSAFDTAIVAVRQAFSSASTFIAKTMFSVLGIIQDALDKIAKFDPTGAAEKLRGMLDVDTEGINNLLTEENDRYNSDLEAKRKDRDAERGSELTEKQAALAKAIEEYQKAISKARAEAMVEVMAAKAKQDAEVSETKKGDEDTFDINKEFEGVMAQIRSLSSRATGAGSTATMQGTFSSIAAVMMQSGGSQSPEERTAKLMEEAVKQSAKIVMNTSNMERDLAFIGTVG